MNTSRAARTSANSSPAHSYSSPHHQALRTLLVFIILIAIGLAARVVYLQVFQRDRFLQLSGMLSSPKQPLAGQPGAIRDCRGRVVADSVITASVKADPKLIRRSHDVTAVSQYLGDELGLPTDQVREKLSSKRDFVYLKRRVPLATSERIMAEQLSGISRDLEYKRVYPEGAVGCHLLGYYSSDYRPLAGVEYQYRFVIEGQTGTPLRNQD
ncbi:MAG: hypothetical protein KAW89_03520, partial [Armatimonadetes bacterium]|nr:hypothetical protein [Armatimonadota bacterium]